MNYNAQHTLVVTAAVATSKWYRPNRVSYYTPSYGEMVYIDHAYRTALDLITDPDAMPPF